MKGAILNQNLSIYYPLLMEKVKVLSSDEKDYFYWFISISMCVHLDDNKINVVAFKKILDEGLELVLSIRKNVEYVDSVKLIEGGVTLL